MCHRLVGAGARDFLKFWIDAIDRPMEDKGIIDDDKLFD